LATGADVAELLSFAAMTPWSRIIERTVDGIVILDMSAGWPGPADASTSLLETIEQLIDQGRIHIVINLGEVRSVDSDGLGEIVRGFNDARDAGGRLALCGVAAHLHELLVTTKLDEYIPMFDSEHEAVRSLQARVFGRSPHGPY
jgi:anti-sigma B factor antagonist